jgi:hypothetical protein
MRQVVFWASARIDDKMRASCDFVCLLICVLLMLACADCACAGANKRKGGRPDLGHHDEYGSGRFGGQLDREMQFFEKVKQRLRSKEQYQDFLKCLNLYAQEIISRNELINLAQVSSGVKRLLNGSTCGVKRLLNGSTHEVKRLLNGSTVGQQHTR